MRNIILLLILSTQSYAQTLDVVGLPLNQLPISVCNHRLNAVATYTDNTDTYFGQSANYAELLAFKNNIHCTFNVDAYTNPASIVTLRGVYSTQRMSFAVYYPTDLWNNPITGVIGGIPDYLATTYTAAGAAVFSNVTIGQTKNIREPNHGQQLYNVSNGAYGYDFTTGTAGTSNFSEINNLTTSVSNYVASITGKQPASISYRNGRYEGAAELNKYYVSGRNSFSSNTGDSRTSFADSLGNPINLLLSRYDRINQASSLRIADETSFPNAVTYARGELVKTIANHGWLNNFMHYHTTTATEMTTYFRAIDSTIGNNFVWRSGYDEAMSYMWLRESVSNISAVANSDTINIYFNINLAQYLDSVQNSPFPYNVLNPYISLLINVKGTTLYGSSLGSSKGKLLQVTDSTFVLDFPITNLTVNRQIYSAKIYGATANYITVARPVITGSSVTASTIDVTTDIPTRAVLFTAAPGSVETLSTIYGRDTTLSTTHHFNITEVKDYRIGVISSYFQSILQLL